MTGGARMLSWLTAAVLIVTTAASGPVHAAGPRIDKQYVGVVSSNSAGTAFPRAPIGSISLMGASYWTELEPRPGVWSFSGLDAKVATARSHKVKPMLVLGFSPSFHASRRGDRTSMPRLWAWKRYVRKVVTRYGAQLDYQVWPEPNISGNWTGTPAQMAILQKAAYNVIKSVAPKARVAGPATVLRLPAQQQWFRKFYAARPGGTPVGRFLDVIALDPYPLTAGNPEASMRLIGWARRTAAKLGVRKPIWTVEINYGIPSGGYGSYPKYAKTKQIAYVLRTYVASPAFGVRKVYWLTWYHYKFPINLTFADNQSLTPAGKALVRARDWMVGFRHQGCTQSGVVWRCTLTGYAGGRWEKRTVLWRTSGSSSWRAPAGSFQVWKGGGVKSSIRGGSYIKVTTVPLMVRQR